MSELATMAKKATDKKRLGRPPNPAGQESKRFQIYFLQRHIDYLERVRVNDFGDIATLSSVIRDIIDDHIRRNEPKS